MPGGARTRLLAATPLLLLAQILLLPLYLYLFAGPDTLGVVDVAPLVEAFHLLIVAPLTGAALVQVRRTSPLRRMIPVFTGVG